MDADAAQEMTEYTATFWTHFAAIKTLQSLLDAGIDAKAGPVPRALSSGCGTCVSYRAPSPCQSCLHGDFERVVVRENGEYRVVIQNDTAV